MSETRHESHFETPGAPVRRNVFDADNFPSDLFDRRGERGYVVLAKDWAAMEKFEQRRHEWRERKKSDEPKQGEAL